MNGRRFRLNGVSEANLELTYQSILDSLAKFQRTPSPIALQVRLNIAEDSSFMAEIKTTAKLPIQGEYQLYVVLLEDSIHGASQISNETEHYHIVRKMLPNANGTTLKTPQPTDENAENTYTFAYTVGDDPHFYNSLDHVGVVAYIQNTATKEIIQATYASANGGWSQASAWVNDSISYTLTLTAQPDEGGTVSGADVYTEGSSVTITATANAGYKFVAWMDGEAELWKEPVYKFRITANTTYTAKFEAKQHHNLTLTASPVKGGSVEGADRYPEGDEVTISAKANIGYKFIVWTNGSDTLSKTATYQFPMPSADVTYTAIFGKNTSIEDMVRANFSVSTDYGQLIVRNLNGILVKGIDIYSLTGERLVRFSPNSRDDLSLPIAAKRTLCIICIDTENGAAIYKVFLP